MNTRSRINAGLLAVTLGVAGQAASGTLTIVIEDIRDASGAVQVQVLAGPAQFEGEGAAAQFRETAVEGSLTLVADGLPPGEYAIRVMHDRNGNDELDVNFVGLPIEPYGFSNNAKGRFGPAAWKDARFELDGDATQVIRLVH
ncbi:MAG: DUF2141 domain-containing protein [Gammaproteobacteria bacterium]|nr:DUF2141 domain-containing protein [Gammaproteobacteria bacterium]